MRGLLHTGFIVITSLILVLSVVEGLLSLQLLLLLATSGIIAVLLDVDPLITDSVVLAYVPWIAVAASLWRFLRWLPFPLLLSYCSEHP